MRVLGLLSWYNERPDWLGAGVASLSKFCDHIVALDGAYFLYPGGKPHSPPEQAEAVRQTARALGMGVTIHEPQGRWVGNEVEKRAALFALAETISEPGDWHYVVDADELVTAVHCDVRGRLAATPFDAADVTLWAHRQHFAPDERPFVTAFEEQQPIRKFFRAGLGVTVVDKHYRYVTADGRQLWGDLPSEPAEDLCSEVRVQHRVGQRDLWRAEEAKGYYAQRDELNIEGLV